ncbi:hypothetical protein ABZ801_08785 [Actinomadura sp. NPDC047616]|uniref:hypothetical protein n=1 Tax=Actinomadura sp. NPDC047616 TaxID=3155914 RepID=UPI00340F8DB9
MRAGRVVADAGAVLRQWRQPREFRIRASAWPADALAVLADLSASRDAGAVPPAGPGQNRPENPPAAGKDDAEPAAEPAPEPAAEADTQPDTGQQTATAAQKPESDHETASETVSETAPGLPGRAAADVATSIWRLRGKLAESPVEPPRAVVRHLESAWDALAEAGVQVQDHLNAPFDSGLALTVVAFQPTPGLSREQVVETVRPSVYLHDRVVQRGEVIVGTPVPSDQPTPGP